MGDEIGFVTSRMSTMRTDMALLSEEGGVRKESIRHCERSEAIHACPGGRLDCFVASAPRNDDYPGLYRSLSPMVNILLQMRKRHAPSPQTSPSNDYRSI